MTDSKSPRPGSARAKLESFNRLNKGRDSMMKKVLIVFILLIVAFVIQFIISKATGSNDYFQIPKDAAWMIREGKWDDLRKVCADDFTVEGTSIDSADGFIKFLSGYGEEGVAAYATVPHRWVKGDGEARIEFWVVWARGDLNARSTIPITRLWLVDAGLVHDGEWKLKDAKIRPSVPGGPDKSALKQLMNDGN